MPQKRAAHTLYRPIYDTPSPTTLPVLPPDGFLSSSAYSTYNTQLQEVEHDTGQPDTLSPAGVRFTRRAGPASTLAGPPRRLSAGPLPLPRIYHRCLRAIPDGRERFSESFIATGRGTWESWPCLRGRRRPPHDLLESSFCGRRKIKSVLSRERVCSGKRSNAAATRAPIPLFSGVPRPRAPTLWHLTRATPRCGISLSAQVGSD